MENVKRIALETKQLAEAAAKRTEEAGKVAREESRGLERLGKSFSSFSLAGEAVRMGVLSHLASEFVDWNFPGDWLPNTPSFSRDVTDPFPERKTLGAKGSFKAFLDAYVLLRAASASAVSLQTALTGIGKSNAIPPSIAEPVLKKANVVGVVAWEFDKGREMEGVLRNWVDEAKRGALLLDPSVPEVLRETAVVDAKTLLAEFGR